tara:strand:+ start:1138 stop:1932 length:795 start_codon:yes stop_codon:yes gene_type:complete
MLLMQVDLDAQSIIKHVSGNVYQVIDNVKKPIRGLNTIINDSSTLILDPSSFMIVDINGQKIMIKGADYKNGIQLINFNNNLEADRASGFWANIFDAVYNDSFDEKKKIDSLSKTRFQGTTRSVFESLTEKWKILPNYKSKIEWPSGINLKINFGNKSLLRVTKEELDYFNIDKHVLSNCKPCHVKVDNEERGLIEAVILGNEDKLLLKSLFSNIDAEIDIEISQFCIIRILIANDLFINAVYYIDEFSDNKLIEDYLIDIQLY